MCNVGGGVTFPGLFTLMKTAVFFSFFFAFSKKGSQCQTLLPAK